MSKKSDRIAAQFVVQRENQKKNNWNKSEKERGQKLDTEAVNKKKANIISGLSYAEERKNRKKIVPLINLQSRLGG